MPHLMLIAQDITTYRCDVIVNDGNNMLTRCDGLDSTIRDAAGAEMDTYLDTYRTEHKPANAGEPFLKPGTVRIIPHFKIETCKNIFMAAAPELRGKGCPTRDDAYSLTKTYLTCIRFAQMNNFKSIALPLLGAGFDYPRDHTFLIGIQAILAYLEVYPDHGIETIAFIFDNISDHKICTRLLSNRTDIDVKDPKLERERIINKYFGGNTYGRANLQIQGIEGRKSDPVEIAVFGTVEPRNTGNVATTHVDSGTTSQGKTEPASLTSTSSSHPAAIPRAADFPIAVPPRVAPLTQTKSSKRPTLDGTPSALESEFSKTPYKRDAMTWQERWTAEGPQVGGKAKTRTSLEAVEDLRISDSPRAPQPTKANMSTARLKLTLSKQVSLKTVLKNVSCDFLLNVVLSNGDVEDKFDKLVQEKLINSLEYAAFDFGYIFITHRCDHTLPSVEAIVHVPVRKISNHTYAQDECGVVRNILGILSTMRYNELSSLAIPMIGKDDTSFYNYKARDIFRIITRAIVVFVKKNPDCGIPAVEFLFDSTETFNICKDILGSDSLEMNNNNIEFLENQIQSGLPLQTVDIWGRNTTGISSYRILPHAVYVNTVDEMMGVFTIIDQPDIVVIRKGCISDEFKDVIFKVLANMQLKFLRYNPKDNPTAPYEVDDKVRYGRDFPSDDTFVRTSLETPLNQKLQTELKKIIPACHVWAAAIADEGYFTDWHNDLSGCAPLMIVLEGEKTWDVAPATAFNAEKVALQRSEELEKVSTVTVRAGEVVAIAPGAFHRVKTNKFTRGVCASFHNPVLFKHTATCLLSANRFFYDTSDRLGTLQGIKQYRDQEEKDRRAKEEEQKKNDEGKQNAQKIDQVAAVQRKADNDTADDEDQESGREEQDEDMAGQTDKKAKKVQKKRKRIPFTKRKPKKEVEEPVLMTKYAVIKKQADTIVDYVYVDLYLEYALNQLKRYKKDLKAIEKKIKEVFVSQMPKKKEIDPDTGEQVIFEPSLPPQKEELTWSEKPALLASRAGITAEQCPKMFQNDKNAGENVLCAMWAVVSHLSRRWLVNNALQSKPAMRDEKPLKFSTPGWTEPLFYAAMTALHVQYWKRLSRRLEVNYGFGAGYLMTLLGVVRKNKDKSVQHAPSMNYTLKLEDACNCFPCRRNIEKPPGFRLDADGYVCSNAIHKEVYRFSDKTNTRWNKEAKAEGSKSQNKEEAERHQTEDDSMDS